MCLPFLFINTISIESCALTYPGRAYWYNAMSPANKSHLWHHNLVAIIASTCMTIT